MDLSQNINKRHFCFTLKPSRSGAMISKRFSGSTIKRPVNQQGSREKQQSAIAWRGRNTPATRTNSRVSMEIRGGGGAGEAIPLHSVNRTNVAGNAMVHGVRCLKGLTHHDSDLPAADEVKPLTRPATKRTKKQKEDPAPSQPSQTHKHISTMTETQRHRDTDVQTYRHIHT